MGINIKEGFLEEAGLPSSWALNGERDYTWKGLNFRQQKHCVNGPDTQRGVLFLRYGRRLIFAETRDTK